MKDGITRAELSDALFHDKPLEGLMSVGGKKQVVKGMLSSIEREDGSGHSFNVKVNTGGGKTISAYVRTLD